MSCSGTLPHAQGGIEPATLRLPDDSSYPPEPHRPTLTTLTFRSQLPRKVAFRAARPLHQGQCYAARVSMHHSQGFAFVGREDEGHFGSYCHTVVWIPVGFVKPFNIRDSGMKDLITECVIQQKCFGDDSLYMPPSGKGMLIRLALEMSRLPRGRAIGSADEWQSERADPGGRRKLVVVGRWWAVRVSEMQIMAIFTRYINTADWPIVRCVGILCPRNWTFASLP